MIYFLRIDLRKSDSFSSKDNSFHETLYNHFCCIHLCNYPRKFAEYFLRNGKKSLNSLYPWDDKAADLLYNYILMSKIKVTTCFIAF